MIIGIDASILLLGGGRTHIVELLRAADPLEHNFKRIVVWGSSLTLALIEDRPWLTKVPVPALDQGLLARTFWQFWHLSREAKNRNCSVILIPGGNYIGTFSPVAVMSRNLLPFEMREAARYGISKTFIRLLLLRYAQGRSFRRADGVIFLSEYALKIVSSLSGPFLGIKEVIPHGVGRQFFAAKDSRDLITGDAISERPNREIRLIYVSNIEPYKHQTTLIKSVSQLRIEHDVDLRLTIVGPGDRRALRLMTTVIQSIDPTGDVEHG